MTAENNLSTPFEFSSENKEKIKTIIAKYPPQYKQSAVMSPARLRLRLHASLQSLMK
jgi:NADH:ubiquinone oxidoreductase subunit E